MRWIGLAGIGVGLALVLSGCHETTGSHTRQAGMMPPPPPPTQCQAEGATWAQGQHATERVAERARMAAGAETVRLLRPGEAHTMEFNANRLNLEVDEGNVIRDVRCG
jgi:hypothetical protein